MSRHPLSRVFAILLAVAFLNASMLQVMSAVAMPMGADMTANLHALRLNVFCYSADTRLRTSLSSKSSATIFGTKYARSDYQNDAGPA